MTCDEGPCALHGPLYIRKHGLVRAIAPDQPMFCRLSPAWITKKGNRLSVFSFIFLIQNLNVRNFQLHKKKKCVKIYKQRVVLTNVSPVVRVACLFIYPQTGTVCETVPQSAASRADTFQIPIYIKGFRKNTMEGFDPGWITAPSLWGGNVLERWFNILRKLGRVQSSRHFGARLYVQMKLRNWLKRYLRFRLRPITAVHCASCPSTMSLPWVLIAAGT